MNYDNLKQKLKAKCRDMFFRINSSADLKKNYVNYEVYVKVDGKKYHIKDITSNECAIYIEADKEI
jgi:hypothetical protein